MITVKLNGSTNHEAVKVGQVFDFKKMLIYKDPVYAGTNTVVKVFNIGEYDAIVFTEDAITDEQTYQAAVEAVETIKQQRPDALRVVVYKLPKL